MQTLGYLITFHTYGSWLHGDAKGSVDKEHNTPHSPTLAPDPRLHARRVASLRHPPVDLDARRRFVVDAAIREVAAHRGWNIAALHVRTTHVHVVVSARASPERVMCDFKAYATRRMREEGLLEPESRAWSHHGSTRYLRSEASFSRAVQYVVNEQGEALPMESPEPGH